MRGKLFSLEDRKHIAENAVKVQVNSTGVEFRIVDMQAAIKYLRTKRYEMGLSPFINISPIHEDQLKDRSYSIAMFNDKEFDVIYGKFLGFSSNGEPRFHRYSISEYMSFDITQNGDAEIWIMLLFFSKLEGSVNEDNPYFRIFDDSQVALDNVKKAELFAKAMGRIKSMGLKDKLYFIRYAYPGKTISSSFNDNILDGLLLEEAMKNPDTFNRLYESKTRSISEVFHSGIHTGVIQNVQEQGFVFEGFNLGISELDAITTLSKDNTILSSVLDRISKHDGVLRGIVSNTQNRKKMEEKETKSKESEKENKNPNENHGNSQSLDDGANDSSEDQFV